MTYGTVNVFHVSSFDCKINYLSQGSLLFSTDPPKNFITTMAHDTAQGVAGLGFLWRWWEFGVFGERLPCFL